MLIEHTRMEYGCRRAARQVWTAPSAMRRRVPVPRRPCLGRKTAHDRSTGARPCIQKAMGEVAADRTDCCARMWMWARSRRTGLVSEPEPVATPFSDKKVFFRWTFPGGGLSCSYVEQRSASPRQQRRRHAKPAWLRGRYHRASRGPVPPPGEPAVGRTPRERDLKPPNPTHRTWLVRSSRGWRPGPQST
jgi:hypothetical protein